MMVLVTRQDQFELLCYIDWMMPLSDELQAEFEAGVEELLMEKRLEWEHEEGLRQGLAASLSLAVRARFRKDAESLVQQLATASLHQLRHVGSGLKASASPEELETLLRREARPALVWRSQSLQALWERLLSSH